MNLPILCRAARSLRGSFRALLLTGAVLGFSLGTESANAETYIQTGLTNQLTLNDLIRELPVLSRQKEKSLAEQGAVQELVLLHERKMRGEGLPDLYQAAFSANYSTILEALIDGRIDEASGRQLLQAHRLLLDSVTCWQAKPNRDEAEGEDLLRRLSLTTQQLVDLDKEMGPVPIEVQTPLINGHQAWIEELLVWGCHCRFLSRGEIGHLRVLASRLERFEGYYKKDGRLTMSERERLHERLIELHRDLIAAVQD